MTPQDRAARFRALADSYAEHRPETALWTFEVRVKPWGPSEQHELTLEDLRAAADALDALPGPEDPARDYVRDQLAGSFVSDQLGEDSARAWADEILAEVRRLDSQEGTR